MGACVSLQKNFVGGSRKKNGGKRSRTLNRRDGSSDRVEKIATLPVDRPFGSPTFHGSGEKTWFDSSAVLESDWSDEDFQSVPDDAISLNGADDADSSMETSAQNSESGAAKTSLPENDSDFRGKPDGPVNETKHVFLDEISCLDGENARGDDSLLDNCGILPGKCLPCLASTVPSVPKRRSRSSSSPPSSMKKAALKLSFKWKDGNPAADLLSSKVLLRRPIAGSQVPFCPLEKRVPDSWSDIDPGTFKIRGVNYFKFHYTPHQFFRAKPMGKELVLYYILSFLDSFAKEVPSHFQENIQRLIDDEVEKVKGFRGDTSIPFRERLKILGHVANVDDLPLSAAERKLMHAYNEKPVLSRPHHEFYIMNSTRVKVTSKSIWICIDSAIFQGRDSKLSQIRLKLCVLEFGLTIQGNKAEELPKQILCCMRLNEIDYLNYQRLGFF